MNIKKQNKSVSPQPRNNTKKAELLVSKIEVTEDWDVWEDYLAKM